MQRFLYLLCFFLGTFTMVQGQENEDAIMEKEMVGHYLENNGTMLQYNYAYTELLTMLAKQFPKKASNKEGWEYLEGNKESALMTIKKNIIPIYSAHFTPAEIKEMLVFYGSETGKKLLNDRANMTAEQKKELSAFYSTAVGQKIIEKQGVLTQEISKVSEAWSRDLYETAVSLLKDE